jgi:hypothetical protein
MANESFESHESKERRKRRKNKERMMKYRKNRAISVGREPGVVGRPPLLLEYEKQYIELRVTSDANRGLFHQMSWLLQLVSDLNQIRGVELKEGYKPCKSWGYNFIKASSKLCLRKPTLTERKRILACVRPNVEKFYDLVAEKYQTHLYCRALKYNLDETPLLIKHPIIPSVICSTDSPVRPTEPPPEFLFKCTALPVVSSDGTFVCCAILFPANFDVSILQDHIRPNFVVYSAPKGSMTKVIFDKFMREEVITRIGFKNVLSFIVKYI